MDDAGDDPSLEVRPPRLEDLVRLARALEDAGARYVLIGGFAVSAHGLARTTKGIDLLVDPSPENVERVKMALAVLEDNAAADIDGGDLKRYSVVRVADEVMVDLLAAACGVTCAEAEPQAVDAVTQGQRIRVASIETLIATK